MTRRLDDPRIESLLLRGQQRGVLALSAIDDLARQLELDDEALEDLHDQAAARGIVREVGTQLGISPERVRQIEVEALQLLAMDREISALHEAA